MHVSFGMRYPKGVKKFKRRDAATGELEEALDDLWRKNSQTQDLTRVVISYEIYQTSLRRV